MRRKRIDECPQIIKDQYREFMRILNYGSKAELDAYLSPAASLQRLGEAICADAIAVLERELDMGGKTYKEYE